jgi:histidinol-phosphate aminotransferase
MPPGSSAGPPSGAGTPGSPRLRAVLERFTPYQPGRRVVSPEGRSFKLASNESPFGPLPSVREAIAAAAAEANRYPDNAGTALTEAIAARYQIPPGHIALGCGSVGVTQQLLAATAEPGTEVIYAWRSFEGYPLLVPLTGAREVPVPLAAEAHDLPAMADAITGQTRVIFVCNPNNPTGTVVHTRELTAFLERVPPQCLVVLDEAYAEFVRDPEVPDGISLYRDYPNLAVLRTFSKAYGLAGLRVGFLVSQEPVAAAARVTMLPFTVSTVAQAAAVAALAAEAELAERVELVVKERTRVRDELRSQGWTVPPTEGNFVWLRLGDDTAAFATACEQAGISVRPFPGEGARVSIADQQANDAFLAVARAYPRRH